MILKLMPGGCSEVRLFLHSLLTRLGIRYSDDAFEYRHVQLPKNMLKKIPQDYFDSAKGTLKLLWEEEWRALGITQVRLDGGGNGNGNIPLQTSLTRFVFL